MRTDPVRQPLAPTGFGISVIGGAQHRDEHVSPSFLSGCPLENRHGVASVVHEQLFASDMGLAHRRADPSGPLDVEVTKPAIAVTVRMIGSVFLPQQQQCHPAPTELGMDLDPIRHDPSRRLVEACWGKKPTLEFSIVDLGWQRPGNPDPAVRRRYSATVVCPMPDADRARDHPHARAARILQPQNLSNFPHRQSLSWHRDLPARGSRYRSSDRRRRPWRPSPQGCPGSIGITVRLPSESVSALPRNRCPLSVGIRTVAS